MRRSASGNVSQLDLARYARYMQKKASDWIKREGRDLWEWAELQQEDA